MRCSPDSLPWAVLVAPVRETRVSGQPASWHCRGGDGAQLIVIVASISPAKHQWLGVW